MWDFIKGLFGNNGAANNGKTILVVDDGLIERKFMQATLSRKGYSVLTAANGDEGIKLAHDNHPDIIFLDFSMPGGLDGKATCRRIKEDPECKNTPVVFLSGSVSPGKVIDCYDAGAEYYLSKPISAATLLEHTRLLLEDAQALKDQPTEKTD